MRTLAIPALVSLKLSISVKSSHDVFSVCSVQSSGWVSKGTLSLL